MAFFRNVINLAFIVILLVFNVAQSQDVFKAIAEDDMEGLLKVLNVYSPNLPNLQNPESLVINRRGPGRQTPLMFAVLSGKTSIVKMLLDRDARVDIGEQDGYTPMHGAGFQGRAEIAKLLIEHGVDPSARHKDGFTPMHRACWGAEQRHTDTVEVFLKVGKVPHDERAADGTTCAEMTKNEATTKLLREWVRGKGKHEDL